jgi:hypothetical protein
MPNVTANGIQIEYAEERGSPVQIPILLCGYLPHLTAS